MADNLVPVAVNKSGNPGGTGWYACDKHGRTWPVTADQAAEIEAQRKANNAAAGKAETPGT